MKDAPSDPLEVALMLAAALDDAGLPYAIGGALAYGLWGIPRGTLDVDINVFVDAAEVGAVFGVLAKTGVHVDQASAAKQVTLEGMFVGYVGPVRVDVFVPSIPFSWEAMRSRVLHQVSGQSAWFLSAEAIAVFKLLFFRGKDMVDLERLLAVQGPMLKTEYIRQQIVDMLGVDDPRTREWDALVSRIGAATE